MTRLPLILCVAMTVAGCVRDVSPTAEPDEIDAMPPDPPPDDTLIDQDQCSADLCAPGEDCRDGQCVGAWHGCGGDCDTAWIDVAPGTVDFGRVPANSTRHQTVTIGNLGYIPLHISAIALEGSPAFSVRLRDVDPTQVNVPADPDGDGPPGIDPGAFAELIVEFSPDDLSPAMGTIIVQSSDPDRPEVFIQLIGNEPRPCLSVSPNPLEFGVAEAGRSEAVVLTLRSCGLAPVTIDDVRLRVADSPFALDPETPITPLTLSPAGGERPSVDVPITFSPSAQAASTNTLTVISNDPSTPVIEVPVTGRGVVNACPRGAVAEPRFAILPLDIIELDASPSTDEDGRGGQPLLYRWSVTQRPAGSTALPVERHHDARRPLDGAQMDDTRTGRALFFADLAGTYTIELTVVDGFGARAPSAECPQPPAIITIEAVPDAGMYVELTWDTPGDPAQGDAEGADLDLHLRHPEGRSWAQAPLDCYWANAAPDWGDVGVDDDPRVVFEDINGAGPEVIDLSAPEDTTPYAGRLYRAGVHYYRSVGGEGVDWGPSAATVRVYLEGVIAGELTRILPRQHAFWEVADVIWTPDEKRVVPIDRLLNPDP